MFSILIPTWNNLAYVQQCIASLRKNSAYEHEIILHINEGSDGTLAWAQLENLRFSFSATNIGICHAMNEAAALATRDYLVYMNDDMYALPNWDTALLRELEKFPDEKFFLSATMIEPRDTKNDCVLIANYGDCLANFQEENLLSEFAELPKPHWSGATWPPNVVHKNMWNAVGGYSLEFSPGMSSDDDFAMKLWAAGCRTFMGVGDSRVYHFMAKSTQRVTKNNGRKQFLIKWGIKQSTFHQFYLQRGKQYNGALVAPKWSIAFLLSQLSARLKLLMGLY